jgi:CubicO group peptidase (beta-lactamase class C family)
LIATLKVTCLGKIRTAVGTLLAFVLFLIAPCNGTAQSLSAGSEGITKITKALVLDGRMGDPGWKSATVYRDFKTVHPVAGTSPSERSELYLAQDAETLYVAVRSFDDEPRKIRASTAVRDNPGKDDWVAFCLDTYDDALSSFFFLVTPRNIQADGTLSADGNPNMAFDATWKSATSIGKRGWIAEMAIPLGSLPFQGSDRVTMSFKLARFISRKSEETDFPEIDPQKPNLEQFQKIVLAEVAPSAVSDAAVFRQIAEENKESRLALRSLPYEKQVEKWGGASVFDYLVFPSRELKPSGHPFHFSRVQDDQKVAKLIERIDYAPGRPVEDLDRFLTRSATTSFIVIKDDIVLCERYANGFQRDSVFTSFSVAKSFDSALVGIAIEEGKISGVRDSITKYLPELEKRDPRFGSITIRDLLQMSAGIRYNEDPPYRDNDATYHAGDLRSLAIQGTSIIDPPASYFFYNDYHPLLIGLILERATGEPVSQYFQEKLWGRLGMEYSGSWSTDLERSPFEKMLVGINARSIDFAKFGRLMLNDGRWDGRQILSLQWVQEATQPEVKAAGYYRQDSEFFARGHYYKYFWWGDDRADGKSDFHAAGYKGQYIYISPQKKVIIVRTGYDYGIPSSRWLRLFHQLADDL